MPAIVLAAGVSARFGARNKLLVPIDGHPLLAHTLMRLTRRVYPLIVVTGYQSRRLIAAMHDALGPLPGVRFVYNPCFRRGVASSIRTGLQALPGSTRRVLLCLGDMPAALDAHLLTRLRRNGRAGIDYARPVFKDRPGHPVLISRRMFADMKCLTGDRGAQSIFTHVPPARRRRIPWDARCIQDADTPSALWHLAATLRRRG